jgi:hypothetical protein
VAANALEIRSLLQITFTLPHLVVGVKDVILEKGQGESSKFSSVAMKTVTDISVSIPMFLPGFWTRSYMLVEDEDSPVLRSSVALTMVGEMRTATRAAAKLLESFMVSRRKVGWSFGVIFVSVLRF